MAVDGDDTEVDLLEGRPFDEEALLIQTADNPSFPPSERYTEYTQGRGRIVPKTTDTGESGVRPSPVTDWSSSSVDYCGDGTNDRPTEAEDAVEYIQFRCVVERDEEQNEKCDGL